MPSLISPLKSVINTFFNGQLVPPPQQGDNPLDSLLGVRWLNTWVLEIEIWRKNLPQLNSQLLTLNSVEVYAVIPAITPDGVRRNLAVA
jgi:hypothetical protein